MPKLVRASDITVVIPTIPGRELLLQRAVASVRAQRPHGPYAILPVKDSERRGAAWARNEGIRRVETPWIGVLDDDDEMEPNHLAVLARGASKTGADAVFTYPRFVGVDEQGRDGHDPLACCWKGQLIPAPINVPLGPDQLAHLDSRQGTYCPHCHYLRGNFLPCCYLVRTEVIRAAGGFPEPYSMPDVGTSGECEDYLALLAMLDVGARFHRVVGVRTWRYNYHGSNTGGRGADRLHELAAATQPRATDELEDA
jgi:glycosyltransferase involved in cell wall biosynthesis